VVRSNGIVDAQSIAGPTSSVVPPGMLGPTHSDEAVVHH
jgi:hypothetical protein